MTQRVELATVMDRLDIDELITGYAVAVDDGQWDDYRALFAPDGRADYRTAGGVEGPAAEVADWLAEMMRLFPVRQHFIVNRRLRLQDLGGYPGDRAEVQADYLNPMRLRSRPSGGAGTGEGDASGSGGGSTEGGSADGSEGGTEPTAPDFVSGGRYSFTLVRTDSGWRLLGVVVQEKWRRVPGTPGGI
ncbi:nuclear transport factor 2 family protein [Streptomyces sp. SID10853]|uniref:nuclear transport factor 2 family protein n=1 Tax=Streptomyces sp. SID10853 TaxID=2706028 RepID=UPI0013C21343|nr:nuclear transport factor 2 family protein [Streptomyces sp. SID10853]NDZ83529.1 nuclear transport factor 2 family protein [Streptomyces sp. SID10853]